MWQLSHLQSPKLCLLPTKSFLSHHAKEWVVRRVIPVSTWFSAVETKHKEKKGFLIQCKFIILCVKIVLFINWIGKLKLVFSHNFELFKLGQNSCIISIQHWQIQFRSLLKWKNRTKEMIETVQLLCRDTISVFVQF